MRKLVLSLLLALGMVACGPSAAVEIAAEREALGGREAELRAEEKEPPQEATQPGPEEGYAYDPEEEYEYIPEEDPFFGEEYEYGSEGEITEGMDEAARQACEVIDGIDWGIGDDVELDGHWLDPSADPEFMALVEAQAPTVSADVAKAMALAAASSSQLLSDVRVDWRAAMREAEELRQPVPAQVVWTTSIGLALYCEFAPPEDVTGAEAYGDNNYLDGLWDDCQDGDEEACDDLLWYAPEGSEYLDLVLDEELGD